MKFYTILNTLNWQEVSVNLMKVNSSHMVNIHLTVENDNLAVLFKMGDVHTRRDNKILAENAKESFKLLVWIAKLFPHVLKTYDYLVTRFNIENMFDTVTDDGMLDVTVLGVTFTIRPSVHPFTKTTLYQIRRDGTFMGSHADFIVAKQILVNGFKRANMPIPSVLK